MLTRLFPPSIDNGYRGHPAGLWLFVPITAITLWRSWAHMALPDGGAQSIATIPLDTYTQGGAATVITIFALWGLSQFLIALFYVVVLLRYRTLLPLMYVGLLLEYVGRLAVGLAKPIVTLETPPGATMNFIFIALATIGLLLALRDSGQPKEMPG